MLAAAEVVVARNLLRRPAWRRLQRQRQRMPGETDAPVGYARNRIAVAALGATFNAVARNAKNELTRVSSTKPNRKPSPDPRPITIQPLTQSCRACRSPRAASSTA